MKVLTNERDKYNEMYEEVREELQAARRDVFCKSAKSQNVSLAAQSMLKRVENERDTALCDNRILANEMESLKDRLKVSLPHSLIHFNRSFDSRFFVKRRPLKA